MKKTLTHKIGVGLRPKHFEHFYDGHPETVSWVEVISENFMDWRSRSTPHARSKLLRIRQTIPVSLHGVSMSLGSADPVSESYLRSLKELIHIIQPMSVSDHLCWTGIEGKNSHDLLPLPYTSEVISHVSDKISRVQDFLGREIAVENLSSYVEFNQSEMTEWEFLSEISYKTGCRLILDINNVFVSSVNHLFDPMDYLKGIDVNRVEHIHLAGHTVKDGYLIDTHDAPICEEVLELYRFYVARNPGKFVMIERDGNIPSWTELEEELKKIHQINAQARGQNETH